MASSSSSPTNTVSQIKYDVFLSFRGVDTRDNFISHLYLALCRKKIKTFIDNQLKRGDEISPSLLDAIEGSKISVVIFSQGYASSTWCLKELVKILKCKIKYGQIVIPVFYGVDPSDVRNQTGKFGDGFSKLEKRFEERLDKLQKWRIALKEAAHLSGFDSHVIRPESKFIEEIVDDILKRLNDMFTSENKDQLVGVESSIKELESLLLRGSKDVYSLGIWGIGGIGKTTIVGAIFDRISCHFESSYFIQDVREESAKTGGLAHLRHQLLSTLLDDGNMNVGIPNISLNFQRKRLSSKRVLIVFDNVTHFEQVEFLVGGLDWFIPGSQIIITTRDRQVLQNCKVNEIYEVKKLFYVDSLKLFSRYAFGQDYPNGSYVELTNNILEYAQGIPLAVKVLGCYLSGRTKKEWESAINKLNRIPHMDIHKVLRISYDGLDDDEKNIFLDIACFFKGENRDLVKNFLDASGFSAEIGIKILIDKSLIIVSNNCITVHDLLQEMGREIVRQESIKDPGKRSRLWDHKDIYQVLTKNTGTEAVEGIALDMSKVKEMHLNPHTFQKMHNLRFLKFYSSRYGDNINKVHHFPNEEFVFTDLKYLHWHAYPLKSLPPSIEVENLVSIEMPHSNIKRLWNGPQHLVNLKHINLCYSKHLIEIPDFSQAANIESLNLGGCMSLVENQSSIKYLSKLVSLHLWDCKNIKKFPEISSCSIKELTLGGTAIEELPLSIEFQSKLLYLGLDYCKRLESLPSRLCKLISLQTLDLSGVNISIPSSLDRWRNLTMLILTDCGIAKLPEVLASCPR